MNSRTLHGAACLELPKGRGVSHALEQHQKWSCRCGTGSFFTWWVFKVSMPLSCRCLWGHQNAGLLPVTLTCS